MPERNPVPLGLGWSWDDLEVGMQFDTPGRTITEADLVAFVNATGMTEELFVNEPFLYTATPYRRRLVPAAMVYSWAEGLVIQAGLIRYTGIAFMEMRLVVHHPVYVGDTIAVRVTITGKRPTHHPDRGVVWATNAVRNADGVVVLEYTPVRLIRRGGGQRQPMAEGPEAAGRAAGGQAIPPC